MSLISAHATQVNIVRLGGMTEYGVWCDNTGTQLAHISVIRGFAHITGIPRTSFAGLRAIVRLNGPTLNAVKESLASPEGIKNGRDDRN